MIIVSEIYFSFSQFWRVLIVIKYGPYGVQTAQAQLLDAQKIGSDISKIVFYSLLKHESKQRLNLQTDDYSTVHKSQGVSHMMRFLGVLHPHSRCHPR